MNTVFFGNGLNRLSNDDSWDQIVECIKTASTEDRIPNTLQFEAKLSSQDHYNIESEKELIIEICSKMKNYQPNEISDALAKLNVDNYITTNYDFTFQTSLMKAGFDSTGSNHSEKTYSIKRYVEFENEQSQHKRIWYIHGELNRKNTIILGHKHYCDYTAKIVDYVSKSFWNGDDNDEKLGRVQSWIDLFFCSDIYIIGSRLSYEEIDLWWLLSYRKRLQNQHPSICNNHIVYLGNCGKGKMALFETLGVEVVSSTQKEYIDKYKEYMCILSKRLL